MLAQRCAQICARICVVVLMLFAQTSTAQTSRDDAVQVSTAEELAQALAVALPGSVIALAPGDYGALTLTSFGGEAENPITLTATDLTATDPAARPVFDRLDLRDVQGLVLEGLVFDYRFAPEDQDNFRPFQIFAAQGITLRNCLFDGDLAQGAGVGAGIGVGTGIESDGYPSGIGLAVRSARQVQILDSEMRSFARAMVISDSTDVTLRGNNIFGMRVDGLGFAQVERVVIEDNLIHDFTRPPEGKGTAAVHTDMIQFWTNGTTQPSRDIVIRNNVLNSGAGLFTQSIYLRNDLVDRGLAGSEMFYRNITIEENVIINAHLHGITVGEVDGLIVRRNTVVRNARSQGKADNPPLWTPQIRVAETSTHVQINRNVTSKIAGYADQADWQVEGNVLIQDRAPRQPGYYDQMFVAARTGDPTKLASFGYLPGGPLDMGSDQEGVGASRLGTVLLGAVPAAPSDTAALASEDQGANSAASSGASSGENAAGPATTEARIRILGSADSANRFTFDASLSLLPGGVSPDQVQFDWQIEDTSQQGPSVTHVFATTGPQQIVLTLTLPDGTTATARSEVIVVGPEVLTFSAATGQFTSFAKRDPLIVPNLALAKGPAILGQGGAVIAISADEIAPFFEARDFELHLRLRAIDGYEAAGELLRIHQSLRVTVTGRGTLDIRFNTATAAQLRLRAPAPTLLDGAWHDLTLRYSSVKGVFAVEMDGVIRSEGKISGLTRAKEHWGLVLGNPFENLKSFDGELESLSLRVNVDEQTVQE